MGSGLIGMDPDAVDRAAVNLAAMRADLKNAMRDIDNQLKRTDWRGPDADRFKYRDWPKYRNRIKSAMDQLGAAENELRRNAADQRRISSADPGSHSVAGPGFGAYTGVSDGSGSLWRPWDQMVRDLHRDINSMKDVWDGTGDNIGTLVEALSILKHGNIDRVAGFTGLLGNVSLIISGAHLGSSLATRDWGGVAKDTAGLSSGIVKKFGPVGYWAGANISIWTDVGVAASHVDWSMDGLKLIADASPGDWMQAIGESGNEYVKSLIDAFKP